MHGMVFCGGALCGVGWYTMAYPVTFHGMVCGMICAVVFYELVGMV